MNALDADIAELRKAYGDLVAIDRRPEGMQYSATFRDGTPVTVIALARNLSDGLLDPAAFLSAMGRAAGVKHAALARPLSWGRSDAGLLHYAREVLTPGVLTPGELSAADIATLGEELARGLAVAHHSGLSHGAITPWRIARMHRGAVLDSFGVFAALVAGGVDSRQVATALGEDSYNSPEVQRGTAPDERSDVYSLGAALYVLLTGKPPFGGRTTSFVMATVLSNRDMQELNGVDDAAVAGIVEALLRAIEHAPEDRWPSASAFADALASGSPRTEMRSGAEQKRGWAKFAAIFRNAWFPTGRSRG